MNLPMSLTESVSGIKYSAFSQMSLSLCVRAVFPIALFFWQNLKKNTAFHSSPIFPHSFLKEKTQKTQGRLHTGDLGYVDAEGYVHISGRIKDIIIRNGVNLSPAKIEAAIRQVPGVENAVVVGLRHEVLGEAPYALVVLKSGVEMTAERLSAELLTRIPKNHIPLAFRFAAEIPLNKIGKPDKHAVKKMFQE